jgi:hypothetical protein
VAKARVARCTLRPFNIYFSTLEHQVPRILQLAFGEKDQMRTLTLVLATAVLVTACGSAPPQASTPAAEPKLEFKPVAADARELMTEIVIPSSDVLFEVGSKPPADDKAWTAVERAAMMLAESGNLLMIGNRAKQETSWMEFSRAMTDAGEIALKAARDKNVDAMLAAGDKVYATCENCHNQYMDKDK